MNEQEREIDFLLAECEQENRLLRARNERLTAEVQILTESLRVIGVREWVGLTDEEVDTLDCVRLMWQDYESCEIHGVKEFYRAIEAKLKEKNT